MGTRFGYMGYSNGGHQFHVNEVAGGSMYFNTDYSHVFKLSPNGSSSAQVALART